MHDGLQVTEHFTTLLTPEKTIPYQRITQLTGITNEMVRTAPRIFMRSQKKIVEMTDDKSICMHTM